MRKIVIAAAFLGAVAVEASAQQPDTVRARRDSLQRAREDSIALVRELEGISADTSRRPAMGPQRPPANPRLMPDLSVIGDFVSDLSPEGSTQEDGTRLGVREIEVALGANVDPYFRADFILGLSDLEGIGIEEAYATAVALPANLQARVGRFHMPFGKQNLTHRAELHTIEYPWVIQRFMGPEAMKGTGLWISKIFAPFGFYQELQLTVVDGIGGEGDEELITEEPPNRNFDGLAFSARLRNYWDVSEAANLELSGSALTGRRKQPFDFAPRPGSDVNAVVAGQALLGADLTFRWRPLEQGLYRSFIANVEFMHQLNARESDPAYLGPNRDFSGAYGFARWQLTRRLHLGARYDWVQDPELDGGTLTAGSGYLQWFPSEFSKVNLAFERTMPSGFEAVNRILLQATFAIGPHRPHPF